MQIILKDKITGNPAYVECSLFELIKDTKTKQVSKSLIRRVNIIYQESEATLLNRCQKHLKSKKKIDIIEIKLLKEW